MGEGQINGELKTSDGSWSGVAIFWLVVVIIILGSFLFARSHYIDKAKTELRLEITQAMASQESRKVDDFYISKSTTGQTLIFLASDIEKMDKIGKGKPKPERSN